MRFGIIFILIVGAALGIGYYFGYDIGFERAMQFLKEKDIGMGDEELLTYTNEEGGFSFSYRSGSDGYVVVPIEEDGTPQHKGGAVLYRRGEWEELQKSDIPREGPPAITVEVFENTDSLLPRDWVMSNSRSNYQLSGGGVEYAVYGGVEGARYMYDGLYRAEAIVFAQGDNIIMMAAAFLEEDDGRSDDFNAMMQTLVFQKDPLDDLIRVTNPVKGVVITSPLKITGEARGTWYFEASFPVVLVDWDGRIIAQSHAEAQGDWMTEDFVPFSGTIEFEKPYWDFVHTDDIGGVSDFMRRGALILKKDNPSGLPQYDNAIEIPIVFK